MFRWNFEKNDLSSCPNQHIMDLRLDIKHDYYFFCQWELNGQTNKYTYYCFKYNCKISKLSVGFCFLYIYLYFFNKQIWTFFEKYEKLFGLNISLYAIYVYYVYLKYHWFCFIINFKNMKFVWTKNMKCLNFVFDFGKNNTKWKICLDEIPRQIYMSTPKRFFYDERTFLFKYTCNILIIISKITTIRTKQKYFTRHLRN